MMKMKFSKSAGIFGGVLPLLMMVFVFLFSGVSASAQNAMSSKINDGLVKQYGENFYDADQAAQLAKQAHKLTMSTQSTDPISEATKSLDMHYAATFIQNIGEGASVKDALTASYSATLLKSKEFVVNVDVSAIHTKYYDLLTQ